MKDRGDTDDSAESGLEIEPFDEPAETDPTEAVEEAERYFPPTDPVVRTDHAGETADRERFRLGRTSVEPPAAAVSDTPSDEALEDLVDRALRLDASTAHLHLKVGVSQGVVRVPT